VRADVRNSRATRGGRTGHSFAGRADHAYLIYTLRTLEIWMQNFIDHQAKCIAT
jgi:hypothetical protein